MSIIFDAATYAIKAISAVRAVDRITGHDSPVIEEAHRNLSMVRAQSGQDRIDDFDDQMIAGGDDGVLGDVLDWLSDLFS